MEKLRKEILDYTEGKEVLLIAVKSKYKELLNTVQATSKLINDNLKEEYVVIVR